MRDNKALFHQMLPEFHDYGILDNVILIGSWVLPVYRHYFSNSPEIPILRTMDVDFLIPNRPKIHIKVDIPKILKKFEFEEQFSLLGNYSKFVHPELEIEFLIPEIGRSKKINPF
ncbi:MAG: GSU2403 family nucleotidyltransferase fold protein [Candidatus Cloacimonadales bacterium]|nr:GSU2403 family nucleotidyltransferase fold protein [Candidatus Cloacimonadales bacterium]